MNEVFLWKFICISVVIYFLFLLCAEKCYFENQQLNQNEGKDEENEAEIEIPSVPADINNQDPRCEVCQEKLEQFYNEDKEEWHLKMAIRVEDKTYHPLCYEDLQV